MRILFVNADDNALVVLLISGICYDPVNSGVLIWTADGDIWSCNDVSQYQYSLWCSQLATSGHLIINDGKYKFTFDE